MLAEYLLGIDIGTSGCKVALFTPDGSIVYQGTQSYQTYYPHAGHVEQNPEEWWKAVCNNLRDMFHRTTIDPKQIKGVGVGGQSWAAIPMDEYGRPLRNAMIWLDRRAVSQSKELADRIGEDELFSVSGNPISPSYITGKILWMKDEEPDLYRQTKMFLQCNSYLVYKLTGSYTQDLSQGNGLHAFDIAAGNWDYSLLERIGIEPELLPVIYGCSDVVGEVTIHAAAVTGLALGTPVVAGGLDAACATLGAGAIHVGETQEQGGQAGGMSIVLNRPTMNRKLILSCHVVKGTWLLQGGTVGGGSLNWMKREFGRENADDFFTSAIEEAARIPAGSEGLLFLPYMAGERSPIWDPYAKGVFLGLSFEKTKGHMIRSILEGCSMALRHNLQTAELSGVSIHALHSVGGAANSYLWTQIKADITGKIIRVPASDSAATLGAAILAGIGTGVYRDAKDAVTRAVRIEREQEPNQQHQNVYDQAYEVFLETYERLKDLFPKMGW